MTGLHQTELTLSQKVQCAAQALARQAHGVITALSVEFGISRPTVYEAASTAQAVLERHFDPASDGTVSLEVDQRQLRRAVVALRVVGMNSIRSIEELLPILYPGHRLSYGKVQSWLADAEVRAQRFNNQVVLSTINAGALDELFSQGQPVLAGIDLTSGYLFSLAVRENRAGEDWAEVLRQSQRQGLDLKVVVKDAAKGIAAGVSELFPDAEQRDDCFHASYELGKVRHRLERRAYAAIGREENALNALRRTRAKHIKQRRKLKHKLAWAQRQCRQAIADFDAFDRAQHQAQAAMRWVDLNTGKRRTAWQVRCGIEHAAESIRQIGQPGCGKVATYLTNRAPGLALYVAELDTQLTTLSETYGDQSVSLACVITQLVDDLQQHRRPWQRREQLHHLMGAYHHLNEQLGDQADRVLERVQWLWLQRHRASSAVEGFNAALRPYLYLHKRATQGFLELYRAYFNLRTRRWGQHKGTSAYQCLTGTSAEDWLTLLGLPPSALAR